VAEGQELAVVLRHVEANDRHFRRNNGGFDFDFNAEAVSRLRRDVEETARQVARGEATAAHLSGTIQAWQVTVCEEWIARGRAARGAAAHATSSDAAGESTTAEDVPTAREAAPRREKPAREQAKPPAESKPRKSPPPKPPADDPQASLFG
jgi:hypothetical protein